MKIRPLSDTDLARIAHLPRELRIKKLRSCLNPFFSITYTPTRRRYGDLLNERAPLAKDMPPPPWEKIESGIIRDNADLNVQKANLDVAKLLYNFRVENDIISYREKFAPVSLGFGVQVSPWLPYTVNYRGRAHIVFVEPRRTNGLDRLGRKFVYSMMHARIRSLNPELKKARLCVIHFSNDDQRILDLCLFDEESELYSVNEFMQMINETYGDWIDIQREDQAERRRAVGGSSGPELLL